MTNVDALHFHSNISITIIDTNFVTPKRMSIEVITKSLFKHAKEFHGLTNSTLPFWLLLQAKHKKPFLIRNYQP